MVTIEPSPVDPASPPAEPASGPRRGATPLWAVLTFTFANSLGTGVVTSGIFFLTRSAYGFGDAANYTLAIVFAAMYIAGAVAVGPLLTRLARRSDAVTHRGVVVGIMLVLAIACVLPLGASRWGAGGSTWAVWALAVVYGPLTGSLWPIVEAYLSGERRGAVLRAATGWFNIVWAGALVFAFWVMAPHVAERPLAIVAALGLVHLGSIPLMAAFTRDPGRHVDTPVDHEPHPPVYRDLLRCCRVLLPLSYVLYASVGPFMPGALDRLSVATHWQTPITATWMTTRVVVFAIMGRWHGWQGRWSAIAFGAAALLLGYAVVVLAPRLAGEGTPGVVALILGLGVFGVGMGVIYAAALYYALEVGRAEVAAGGAHEALIGLGYLLGPGVMLLGTGAVALGWVQATSFEGFVLLAMALVTLGAVGVIGRNLTRAR
ncbi:MAG: hypothetical protein EA378_01650 [Phycisphaerales bacterium]|nr:MAG: hypothetical protein EA378_01650 [Phycisphaerales bacterium]